MAGGGSVFLRAEYSINSMATSVWGGQPQMATVQPFRAGVLISWPEQSLQLLVAAIAIEWI